MSTASQKYHQEYYQMNRERLRAYAKEYSQKNKERKKQYNHKYHETYKESLRESNRQYRKKNKERLRAFFRNRSATSLLVTRQNGKVVYLKVHKRTKPDGCENCPRKGCRLEYHHWDDSNPSKGIWLCHRCHSIVNFIQKDGLQRYYELKKQLDEEANR